MKIRLSDEIKTMKGESKYMDDAYIVYWALYARKYYKIP